MKFPFRTKALASAAALCLALALAGCSAGSMKTVSEVTGNSTFQSAAVPSASPDTSTASAKDVIEDTHFDADDLHWDASAETTLVLADSGSTAAGRTRGGLRVRRHREHQCRGHLPRLRDARRRPAGGGCPQGCLGADHPGRRAHHLVHRPRHPGRAGERGAAVPGGGDRKLRQRRPELCGHRRGRTERRDLLDGGPDHRRARRVVRGGQPPRRHRER